MDESLPGMERLQSQQFGKGGKIREFTARHTYKAMGSYEGAYHSDTYALVTPGGPHDLMGKAMSASVHTYPARQIHTEGERERGIGEQIIRQNKAGYGRAEDRPPVARAQVDLATLADEGRSPVRRTTRGRRVDPTGQQKLFGTDIIPARSEVYSLFSDPSKRARVPGFLGTVAHVTEREYGTTIEPPAGGDLSPNSSRLVQKLQSKGLVSADAPSAQRNTIDFDTAEAWADANYDLSPEGRSLENWHELAVPEADVAAGRVRARSWLRGAKTKPVAHGPTREEFQMKLPGLE